MLKGGVIMDVVNAEQVGSILVLRFSAVRHEPTVCVRFSFKQAEDHVFSWALRNFIDANSTIMTHRKLKKSYLVDNSVAFLWKEHDPSTRTNTPLFLSLPPIILPLP